MPCSNSVTCNLLEGKQSENCSDFSIWSSSSVGKGNTCSPLLGGSLAANAVCSNRLQLHVAIVLLKVTTPPFLILYLVAYFDF
jgi:hypothetical protein